WATCLPTDARSFSKGNPATSGRSARPGGVRASGSRTDLAPPCPERLPRSMPVCKILPGSGGFVAFLGDRTEEAVLLEWAGCSAALSRPGPLRRRVPEAGHPAEPAVQDLAGLLEELGDLALVDVVGDGDAPDPVDVTDAGVEDAGAVRQEDVGRALDAAAAAPPPAGDPAGAGAAAVEGVEELAPVEAGRGGHVGQDRPDRQVAPLEEEGPAGGPSVGARPARAAPPPPPPLR